MKNVVMILVLVFCTNCARHYGEGASSFGVKRSADSPAGAQLKGHINDAEYTEIPVLKVEFKNQDIDPRVFPETEVFLEHVGLSVEECRLGLLNEENLFEEIAAAPSEVVWYSDELSKLVFVPTKKAKARNVFNLVVKCKVIRNQTHLKAKFRLNTERRDSFANWLQKICPPCRRQIQGEDLEL